MTPLNGSVRRFIDPTPLLQLLFPDAESSIGVEASTFAHADTGMMISTPRPSSLRRR